MPRKTRGRRRRADGRAVASMRPRPDAAENMVSDGHYAAGWWAASMRPRPDAAENGSWKPGEKGAMTLLQ